MSKLSVELGLIDNLSSQLARLQGVLGRFSSDVSNKFAKVGSTFSDTFKGVFGAEAAIHALTGAWNTLKGVVVSGMEAYDKQITAEASLRESLGFTSRALLEQADALMKVTRYDDEETIAAMARLSLYVKDEEAIKRLIPLVQDFATAKGMDLVTASEAVGKSIGTTTNTLGRYGVQISDTRDRQERLEEVTKKLTDGFQGQARAMAEIGMGPMIRFNNAWGEVKEKLAEAVLPALNGIVNKLHEMMPAIENVAIGLGAILNLSKMEAGAKTNMQEAGEIKALGDAYKQATTNRILGEHQLQAAKKRGSQADTEYYEIRVQELKNEETLALRAVQAWKQKHPQYGTSDYKPPKPRTLPDIVGVDKKPKTGKPGEEQNFVGLGQDAALSFFASSEVQLAKQQDSLDKAKQNYQKFSAELSSIDKQIVENMGTVWDNFASTIEDRLKNTFDILTDLHMSWTEKWEAILNNAYKSAMDLVWQLLAVRVKAAIAERAVSKATTVSVASDNLTQAGTGAGVLAIDSAKSVAKYPYVGAILALAAGAAAAAWAATQISKSKSYQMGTGFHPGGLARLHNNELVELPRGTRVYNSGEAGQVTNNSTSNNVSSSITVNAGRLSVRDLVAALGEAQRSGQLRGFQRDFALGMAR